MRQGGVTSQGLTLISPLEPPFSSAATRKDRFLDYGFKTVRPRNKFQGN